jgi:Transposase DDE domain
MAQPTPRRLPCQVAHACYQRTRAPGLPFAQHLPAAQIQDALQRHGVSFRQRIFTPAITLWTFLSQLLDPDHSCRKAVARLLAWRTAQGLPPCSPENDAYCKARARLPEGVLHHLTQVTGRQPLDRARGGWLWKGRSVKIVDGTCVSMPDTPANQKEYPQPPQQKPGCGFPLLRLVVVFSLAVGTVLDAAFGRYQGQGTGEPSLFRTLEDVLVEGDVLLADRGYCSYWEIARARARGVEVVLRLNASWAKDRDSCRRLKSGDRRMRLKKPRRPSWMSAAEYAAVADELWVRVVRVRVRQRGFRTEELWVATTLSEAVASREEIADLYRARWQAELDLRALKQTLQLDILRGKSPAMVRKEVWGHLLVYNVIRGLMARAAAAAAGRPRELSFTGAWQTFESFLPHWRVARTAEEALRLVAVLLWAIGQHRVGNRPDRYEPRKVKRRRKQHPWLNEPRPQAKARLAKGS